MDQRFVKGSRIDWPMLEIITLANEEWDLILVQDWEQFFSIDEPMYWELKMEVMSSFKLDWMIISLNYCQTISFQMFGWEYQMSYTEFSVVMGLINVEYTSTKSYS